MASGLLDGTMYHDGHDGPVEGATGLVTRHSPKVLHPPTQA